MCKRLSLYSPKKICGKSTELLVARHTTDRAELAYWCDTHAFIKGTRKGTLTIAQGACGVATCSLSRDKEVARLGRNWNDFVFPQSTAFTLAGQSGIGFPMGTVAHIELMGVAA